MIEWSIWKNSGKKLTLVYIELSKGFKEFLQLLSEKKVKYLVIGGYAVNFHGYPSYTKDIDLWELLKKENLESLTQALGEFGFDIFGISESDSTKRKTSYSLATNQIGLIY